MEKFYCQIIYKNADAYPNLKVLYEAALVCPSTWLRKRVLVKTNHRNLLKVNHVNQLAMISIESSPLSEYKFKEAFNVSISKKHESL
jgi:hypothetical protein